MGSLGSKTPASPDAKPNPAGAVVASCPLSIPKSCPDAPKTIELPKGVSDEMKQLYSSSFPGGKSQEQGGTLVADSKGVISLLNTTNNVSTSGTFQPNRTVPAGDQIIGTVHTHPYDASEGGYQGVSFSGADLAYANYYKEPIYVDAGTKQFMVTPTQQTPASATLQTINADWDKEYASGLAAGKGVPDASKDASNTVAQKYKMAYYEGQDGKLTRVSC